jgi:hypothetical protein
MGMSALKERGGGSGSPVARLVALGGALPVSSA